MFIHACETISQELLRGLRDLTFWPVPCRLGSRTWFFLACNRPWRASSVRTRQLYLFLWGYLTNKHQNHINTLKVPPSLKDKGTFENTSRAFPQIMCSKLIKKCHTTLFWEHHMACLGIYIFMVCGNINVSNLKCQQNNSNLQVVKPKSCLFDGIIHNL